jgi:Icc-related predicted phosphoesterase
MNVLRLLCLSDLHGWLPASLPACDGILIAGDVFPTENHSLEYQRRWAHSRLRRWLDRQGVPVRWTFGNHDWLGQDDKALARMLGWNQPPTIDAACDVAGARVHLSPWSPRFGHWAFMDDDDQLADKWALAEAPLDVLVTHTPMLGVLDRVVEGSSEGSQTLVEHVMRVRPILHVCGHIHESRGVQQVAEGITSLNASVRRRDYSITCIVHVAHIDMDARKLIHVESIEVERDWWRGPGGKDEAPWGLFY